ncbi:MAG: O-antigen ligase family protein, partial [Armatimonadota bacterium]
MGKSKVSTLHLALLYAAVFAAPLAAGRMNPVASLAMEVLVLAAALVRLGDFRPPRGLSILVGVYFALLAASAVDSVYLGATMKELANTGAYLLVFLLAASLSGQRRAVYGLLCALGLSATIVGALAVREYMAAGDPTWRVFGSFFNPDYLAGFAALTLPVLLAWHLSPTSTSIRFISALGALFVLAALLASGSRFGVVAAAGGLLVFILLAAGSRTLGRRQALALSLLVIPAVLVFLFFGKPVANRLSASTVQAESHSGSFRIYTWRGALRMAEAHPVNGTGLGTFEAAYPKYAIVGYTKLAHNSYLQVAAEAGFPALAALLALLGASSLPVASSLLRKKINPDPESAAEFAWTPEPRLLACGLLGGVAASIARNLVDSDWYVTAVGISFWAVLGAAVALVPYRSLNIPRAGAKTALSLALILVLVTLAGEAQFAVGEYETASRLDPLNAEPHRRMGMERMMTGDPSGAESEFRKAIRLSPTSGRNHYILARLCESEGRYKEAASTLE